MEIRERHVEWVIVDRLRRLLENTAENEFDVTSAFAVFSAICGWVRQRVGAFRSPSEWPRALNDLNEAITSPTWGLSRQFVHGTGRVTLYSGSKQVDILLPDCSAWQFTVWLRNAMAHADGRVVTPVHEKAGPNKPHRILTGFRIENGSGWVSLNGNEMRRIGGKLAQVFCMGFSEGASFEGDARQGVRERAA